MITFIPIRNEFIKRECEENPRLILAAESALHYDTVRDMCDELKHDNSRMSELDIDKYDLFDAKRKAAEWLNFEFSMLEKWEVGTARKLIEEWENELYAPDNDAATAIGRDGYWF